MAGTTLPLGPVFAWHAAAAVDQGKLNVALPLAEKAIILSPRYARGYYVRGRVRLERGLAGDLEDLTKAAELSDRKDASALHALADALYRHGKVKEAVVVQRAAVKLKPKDREFVEQLALFEKELGEKGLEEK